MSVRLTRREFALGAAAIAAVAALPGSAFAADDPIAFAKTLYALPNLWSDVTENAAAIDKYLDKNLGALITANYAKTNEEAALDYDPLVQAQDYEDIKATFAIDKQTDTTATVNATVDNFGEVSVIVLDLTHTPKGWRLSDIRTDPDSPSLVEELKTLNATTGD